MKVSNNQGLNKVQETLLRLFSRPMSEEETLELKRVLVAHYSHKLREEIGKVTKEKGYKQTDFDALLSKEAE